MQGYINTPVVHHHYLKVTDGYTLYIEECGNPQGIPVLFLHGGPGGEISELSRRFFDPQAYRIILFDQRGCGKSTPFLSVENNTIFASVADIEAIRQYLQIERWIVFGGSYGSTLALVYAIHHVERVLQLVLRGIFLGRKSDIDWLFQEGAGYFYPEEFERFKQYIPQSEQHDLVQAYYKRMLSKETQHVACKNWSNWEDSIVQIVPKQPEADITPSNLAIGLLEAHYFANGMFWEEDNYILNRANQLSNTPISIFHGRYDVDCRPSGAFELKRACPHALLHIVEEAGHSPADIPLFEALFNHMEKIKKSQTNQNKT